MRLAKRRFLVDVNVLLALPDVDHVHHVAALRWFNQDGGGDWGTCIFTESGFIRIMANPRIGGCSVAEATSILALLTQQPGHRFWPMLDSWNALTEPFAERLFGHQQATDACLLGLAVRADGVLVTMDKALAYLAGTKYRNNLLLLDPA